MATFVTLTGSTGERYVVNVDVLSFVERPGDGPAKVHFIGGGEPLSMHRAMADNLASILLGKMNTPPARANVKAK